MVEKFHAPHFGHDFDSWAISWPQFLQFINFDISIFFAFY